MGVEGLRSRVAQCEEVGGYVGEVHMCVCMCVCVDTTSVGVGVGGVGG